MIASDSRFLHALQKFTSFSNRFAATEAVSPSSGEEVLGTRPTYVFPLGITRAASTAKCPPSWKASFASTNRTSAGSRLGVRYAVVLDGIIRGPRAARLAHHFGAVELGDAISAPQRLEVRASARIFFLKSLAIERIFTCSDYRPETDG